MCSSRRREASQTSAITTAKDALILAGPEANQVEIHLGAGGTHEYDPRQPDRYNVTTFGETDIPVDVSASAAGPARISVTG